MIERLATFLLAIFIAAYWARVLRMVRKQRKRTGRAANFIPRERTGKWLRLIWNPVVGLWIILPLLATVLDSPPRFLSPVFDNGLIALPCALLAGICFVATLVCWQKMGSSWRMGIDPGEKTALIFGGPFAYVRHPIYALSMLMMLASVATLPSPAMFAIGAIHISLLAWEARREERYLVGLHGEIYAHYLQNTGGLFPRSFQPYVPQGTVRAAAEGLSNGLSLNLFQRLMRWWDQAHPYNAIHILSLAGVADLPQMEQAWRETLSAARLGNVTATGRKYAYQPVSPGQSLAPRLLNAGNDFNSVAAEELNTPFASNTVPLRIFVQQAAGMYHLGLTYSHWIGDAHSLRMLLLQLLLRLQAKGTLAPQVSPTDVGYWRAFSPAAARWDLLGGLLHLMRSFCEFRQMKKVSSEGINEPRVEVLRLQFPLGALALRDQARRQGVKVNDLFMAGLLEAASRHVPTQTRRKRQRLAVGNVVNIRPLTRVDLSCGFGLFLGLTHASALPRALRDWPRLLKSVSRQNQRIRQQRLAATSFLRLFAASVAAYFSSVEEMYHFFRKEMPLAAGVSNVNLLDPQLVELQRTGTLLRYERVAPTGPMVPVALAVTTLGDQLSVVLTYRKSLITPARAGQIAESLCARFKSCS